MTTGDIQLIREFVEATAPWYASLTDEQKRAPICLWCGVKPDRMKQLSKTLEAFLAAYDQKHGTA